jgi:TRAP-type uncharacterized transport system fused permease subunit
LLSVGSTTDILVAAISASVGVVCLSGGLAGWLLTRTALWQRILLVIAGISLIHSNAITDAAGIFLFVTVLLVQRFDARRAPAVDSQKI